MNIQEPARVAFQEFCDSLMAAHGATILVHFPDEDFISIPVAGIRVMEAMPIFNRKTGAVQDWRYFVLFAEMAVLDMMNMGHTVHVFRGLVTERAGHYCWLQQASTGMRFLISKNDPHDDVPRQAAIYKSWDAAVERAGGVAALQRILDEEAAMWLATDKTGL